MLDHNINNIHRIEIVVQVFLSLSFQAIIEDLDRRLAALEAVKEAADEMAKQKGMDDEQAKGRQRIFYIVECARCPR